MTFDPNNRPEQWGTYTEYAGFEVWFSCWEAVRRVLEDMVPVTCLGKEDYYLLPPTTMLYNKDSQGVWVVVPILRVIYRDTKSIVVSEQEPTS